MEDSRGGGCDDDPVGEVGEHKEVRTDGVDIGGERSEAAFQSRIDRGEWGRHMQGAVVLACALFVGAIVALAAGAIAASCSGRV